jgi:O-antigen/teichoic acid export membrane protein
VSDRLPFSLEELPGRTVRGVVVNGVFLVLAESLVLVQGLIVARELGPRELGLYGIVSITVVTLIALKRVGIDEAYVQQSEVEQEREFQRAFTLELGLSLLFALAVMAIAPLVVAVYGDSRLLLLMLALSYLPVAQALQAPLWIFLRRMDFLRQRGLQAIVPVVNFAVTVPLVLNGVGVWSLVIGAVAGNLACIAMAVWLSPYPLRLSFDRSALRRYFAFSWPIFAVTLGGLIVNQGQVLAFNIEGGLAATGWLALAVGLTRYAGRADQIISPAIYPAICAVPDRQATLERLFTISSRMAAVWSLGLGALFVLFAPDLVELFLDESWEPAVVLLQGLAAVTALYYFGYGAIAFARGMGTPRPPAVEAAVAVATFLLLAVPALFLWGRTAFVLGMVLSALCILAVRARYVHGLFPGLDLIRLAGRAVMPLIPACAAVVGVRVLLWGGERSAIQAAVELVLFVGAYAAATWFRERGLARELVRVARNRAPRPA